MRDLKRYLLFNSRSQIRRSRQAKQALNAAQTWLAQLKSIEHADTLLTNATLSRDSKHLTIFYLGKTKFKQKVARNFRRFLSEQVNMRILPVVTFKLDYEYQQAAKVEAILQKNETSSLY